MALIDRLRELVEPICLDLGLELYDLDLNGGVFKVTVDAPGGVGLTAIAELTREISRALDVHDPISGHYTLEVSSPGLERQLRTPSHWARAVGSTVKVKVRPNAGAERRLEGAIVSAGDDTVVLRTTVGERTLAYVDIDKARTVFEWGPAPKPGTPAKTPKQARKQPVGAASTTSAGSPADDQATGGPAASTESSASLDAVKVVNA
jgi:ribosome maturation factor RimP